MVFMMFISCQIKTTDPSEKSVIRLRIRPNKISLSQLPDQSLMRRQFFKFFSTALPFKGFIFY